MDNIVVPSFFLTHSVYTYIGHAHLYVCADSVMCLSVPRCLPTLLR